MPWYKVAEASEGKQPEVRRVNAGGKNICLINDGEKYFATQLRCPHAGGDLGAGWCAEGKLVCPLHRYSYNLQTGRGSEGQGDYISTYEVKVEDGGVFVRIDTFIQKLKHLFGN